MANNDQSSNNIRFNEKTQALEYANGLNWNAVPGTGSSVVDSVNGLHGNVTLAAGSNITLTPSGQTITIAATGGGASPSIQLVQAATPGSDQVDYTVGGNVWDVGTPNGTPLSLTITPSSSSATIRISLVAEMAFEAAGTPSYITIFMDSTNLYGVSSSPNLSYGQVWNAINTNVKRAVLERYVVPGDTSPHTFVIQGAYSIGSDGFSIGTGDLTFIVEEVH